MSAPVLFASLLWRFPRFELPKSFDQPGIGLAESILTHRFCAEGQCLKMQPLRELPSTLIDFVFTDIDGTLTENGRLPAASYRALWDLYQAGVQVIPVTGRPAGWCDLIARQWPVHGVIGENGALYYRLSGQRMIRREVIARPERLKFRRQLKVIAQEVKKKFPSLRIAADQFSRRFDLAIDFAEDVGPFPLSVAEGVREVFEKHGAHAKISNIHVNGWFGEYDKLSMCKFYCSEQLGSKFQEIKSRAAFVGDSPNDEPMFAAFEWSFAVANIRDFAGQLQHLPRFVSNGREAAGFSEIAQAILRARSARSRR